MEAYVSNVVPSHDELPHVLPANMTNVWVFEVGCKEYPGDLLIKHIAQRQLRQLCFPRVFLNEMPVGFPATMFLNKPVCKAWPQWGMLPWQSPWTTRCRTSLPWLAIARVPTTASRMFALISLRCDA